MLFLLLFAIVEITESTEKKQQQQKQTTRTQKGKLDKPLGLRMSESVSLMNKWERESDRDMSKSGKCGMGRMRGL